jgi:hypothetical protein
MTDNDRKQIEENGTTQDQYIKIYMNRAQWLAYHFNANKEYVQAGRATGKTDFIITPRLVRISESMPRGVSAFLGNSIKQLFAKTMPTTICAIERMTPYRENTHFFRGQPPKNLDFEKPLVVPREWSNVLYWYNGHVWHCISMEIKASANSYNLVSLIGDEARYLPGDKVREEVFPAVRGLTFDHPAYSEKNPFYKSYLLVSDAPITAKQSWMQEFEKLQTTAINREIVKMLNDFLISNDYGINLAEESPKFLRKLKFLQSRSVAYFNFSTLENIDILGDRYIKDMEMNLSDFVFRTSILNQRVNKVDGCYYFFFDPDGQHGYLPSSASQMTVLEDNMTVVRKNIYDKRRGYNVDIAYEAADYENFTTRTPITSQEKALGLISDDFDACDCRFDTDVRPDQPLRIAFDWNKGINAVVTGQIYDVSGVPCINILSSRYVKEKGKRLRTLCKEWCDYYEPQRRKNRNVIHYYDATANQGGNYADENFEKTRFYNIVWEELTARGWNVQNIHTGQPLAHGLKFQWMGDFMTGKTRFQLRMNTENCADLVIAMRATTKVMGKTGPMKNKSGEKRDSESGELVLQRVASDKGGDTQDSVNDVKQYRTDVTDAFDELVIGVHKRDFAFSDVSMPLF